MPCGIENTSQASAERRAASGLRIAIATNVITASARLNAPTSRTQVLVERRVHRHPTTAEGELVVEVLRREQRLHPDRQATDAEDPQQAAA